MKARAPLGRLILADLLASLLFIFCTSALAGDDYRSQKHHIDIERMMRVSAIKKLSAQAGEVLLGYLSSDMAEEEALVGPIQCECTLEEAIQGILRDSALQLRWVNATMASVEPDPLNTSARIRTAPIESNIQVVTPRLGSMTVAASAIHASQVYTVPLVILDRERIEQIGAPTLGELLRQLPHQYVTGKKADGSQHFDLYGLGSQAARVLVNGRRVLPSAGSLISDGFDLNSIPLSAVERIEILPPSASALYGIDALSGIVNVVLRRAVTPAAEFFHSVVAGGSEQDQAVLTAAAEGDRGHGLIAIEYTRDEGLLGRERARWGNQDFRRFGGADQRTLNSVPNITSWSGEPLPGLDAPFASVSPSGASTLRPHLRNYDSAYQDHSIEPEQTRLNAAMSGEIRLQPDTLLYGELLHASHHSVEQFAPPSIAAQVVSADNPHNPLGVQVIANATLRGLSPQQQHIESDLTRIVAGLTGLRGPWRWELSLLHSQQGAQAWLKNAIDSARVSRALTQTDSAQALNTFVSGPMGEPELLRQLLAAPTIHRQRLEGEQVTAVLRRPLLATRAGDLSVMLGAEWRVERIAFNTSDEKATREVTSGLGELHVPIVGQTQHVPLIQELSARLAFRSDDYSEHGRLSAPQYGLRWSPVPALTLHAIRGKSARPPSLYEQFAPPTAAPAQAADPLRDDEQASLLIQRGGNADLPVSFGTSFDAGFELSSTNKALLLSVSYWDVSTTHRSGLLPLQIALSSSGSQTRIERDSPSPADIAAGRSGPARSVDLSRLDLGSLEASGYDLSLSHGLDTPIGRVTPRLDAIWIRSFKTAESGALVDRAGVASEYGSIPRWRATASLNWERGALSAFVSVRHNPAYVDAVAEIRTDQDVAAQTLIDFNAAIDLGRLGLTQSRLSVGATNVFDQAARFARVGGPAGFDATQSDLEERRVFLRLTQRF